MKFIISKSILDEVKGIGKVRKKKLLAHFKTFKNLKNASVSEMAEVVPISTAKELYEILNK